MQIGNYGYVGLFLIVGILFGIGAYVMSWLLRIDKPNWLKNSTYECGEPTVGSSWIQFNIRFYIVALTFVIFDVETVFLIPWAVTLKQIGLYGYVEMMIFIGILAIGLIYAWRKGALKWL